MAVMIPFPQKATLSGRFERLLRPHLQRLYRLAHHLTGSRDDAEDLVQDVCVKLFPRLAELERVENLAPWLARVLYNQFIDHRRRQTNSPVDFVDELPEVASEAAGPEEVALSHLQQDRIINALQLLSDDHRALIAWHDIEGYTLDELSDREGVPIGTLKSRLHRARARMRELLMEPLSEPVRVQG